MIENHYLSYEVKLLSDSLIVNNHSDGNMVRTYEYIPGTTMLGVFANQYIKNKIDKNLNKNAHLDEKFFRYFLKGELIFTNAYLVVENEDKDKKQFYPTPLSVHAEKKDYQNLYNLAYDENINTSTKPLGGFSEINDGYIIKKSVYKKLNFHHQRDDRLKGSSKDGTIFIYESLQKGQTFCGRIIGKKEQLHEIKQLFGEQCEIRIGRSKQTQYGRALLTLSEIEPNLPSNTIDAISENENKVALVLRSPTILLNENGYPEVSIKLLYEYLKEFLHDVNFEIVNQFAKVEYVENYVSVWQMKKPRDAAFSAGSVFILSFPDGLNESIKNNLNFIEMNGIGERRHEGFGNIKISPIEKFYQFDNEELDEGIIDKPDYKPTNNFEIISKQILKEAILNSIESLAYFDAGRFKVNRLNNSLLGRLENMLVNSETFDDFLVKLEQLKKQAKDQLYKCNDDRQTLYDYLNSGFDEIKSKLTQLNKINKFFNNVKIDNPLKDNQFVNNCMKLYWITFFRRMRKLNLIEVKS